MKLLAFLFLTLTSAAFAQNAGVFIGKYSVEASTNCLMGVDASRAYVSLASDSAGRKILAIRSYGIESRMREIPVERSLVQAPGTRAQDRVVARTEVKFTDPMSMVVKTTTTAPAMNISYSETFS